MAGNAVDLMLRGHVLWGAVVGLSPTRKLDAWYLSNKTRTGYGDADEG